MVLLKKPLTVTFTQYSIKPLHHKCDFTSQKCSSSALRMLLSIIFKWNSEYNMESGINTWWCEFLYDTEHSKWPRGEKSLDLSDENNGNLCWVIKKIQCRVLIEGSSICRRSGTPVLSQTLEGASVDNFVKKKMKEFQVVRGDEHRVPTLLDPPLAVTTSLHSLIHDEK